jgi:hypothetical protein
MAWLTVAILAFGAFAILAILVVALLFVAHRRR